MRRLACLTIAIAFYVQPTFTADRGWLHLEARYNYEALDTGSAWVGYNFSGGEKLNRIEFAIFATTYFLTEVPLMLAAIALFRASSRDRPKQS